MTIDIILINYGHAHCKVLLLGQTLATKVEANDRHALGAEPILYLGCMTIHSESLMSPQHPAMNVMQFWSSLWIHWLHLRLNSDEARNWRPPRHPLCWILILIIEAVPRLLQQRISLEEKRRDQAIEQLTTFMTDAINTVSNRMEEPWLQLTETFWIFLNYVRWRECILR